MNTRSRAPSLLRILPMACLALAPLALAPVAAAALALAVTPAGASATDSRNAVIRGEVRDSADAAMAGVEVVLRDEEGRVVARTTTDGAGRYIMVGLTAGGPYTLAAERLGFGEARRENLHLAAGESRRIDLTLVSRPVELPGIDVVTAADMVFSGTRTGAGTVIEERAIVTLPTVDRDITGLAALSPMVALQEQAMTVAGQNSRFNSLRVDGALTQDVFGLSTSGVPGGQANARALPFDAIRQYAILVAPYDVRHSGFTGGLLNATTRSGGDRWEAAAFAYYRDAAFSGGADDGEVRRSQGRGADEEFRTETGGFTVGGPIGRARLFAAGEFERRSRPLPGFHVGRTDPLRLGLAEDSVTRMIELLGEVYDIDPGDASPYTLTNPLGNVFVRGDVPLGGRHDLTVRYNFISAEDDVPVGHLGFGPYELSSKATRLESRTHSVGARLASRLGDRTANEVIVNVQRTADARRATSDLPQIEVRIDGSVDGLAISRLVQLGGDALAHENALEQTILQVGNTLSHAVGDHLLTAGVDGLWIGIDRSYLPASRGIWRFEGLADLAANRPMGFERLVLLGRREPGIDFSVLQLSTFAQDEWSVGRDLSVTLGIRLEVPMTMSRPEYNRAAEIETGVVTDRLPSGNPTLSPRLGFNWSPPGRWRTQVRGGAGLFTALPPLAWISDAYTDTGLRTALLTCADVISDDGEVRTRHAPELDPDRPPPSQCLDGAGPTERHLTFFSDDFRYPQDVRASIGVDRELPGGFVATVEALYTRALHQVALEDLNLGIPVVGEQPAALGYPDRVGPRPIFGRPLLVPTRFGPLAPDRRWDGYGRVIEVGNRSRNAALAVAAEVQRRFSDRLDLRVAYAYNRGVDTRSLLYQDAGLNYGRAATRGDPARPETRPTSFDRPHRVLGSGWARLAGWGDGLDATLLYVGQSGLPYSYVYESDINGDGYPGPAGLETAYNDLFFIPQFGNDVPGGPPSQAMVFQLAALEPCLGDFPGYVSARNQCRAPWSNRLDLRVAQGLSTPVGRVRITGDIVNVLNLLNREWGLVHVVPPVVPIFRLADRLGCPGPGCSLAAPLNGRYTGPRRRDPESGLTVAELPYQVSLPDSQWRAQIGLRVEF